MSFKLLTNLRCLFLEWWELGDISFVGYMKKLESLTLRHCSFFELPDAVITQLTNLRLLHLSKCDMKKNPFEVIGRHPLLEELYFYERGFDNGDNAEFFKNLNVPKTLRRYQIKLGPAFEDYEEEILNGHRTLILSCFDTSNAAIVDMAKKAEVLLVANIKGGGKNIIPDIFQIESGEVMNNGWIELWLCDSEKIECLVDTSSHSKEVGTLFSELRKLSIERMEQLVALYHGMPPIGLFERLEQLYIYKCPLLTCLFIHAVARNLVLLEKLEIVSCDGLKHILADDDIEVEEISREDDNLVFSKLKQLRINECLMLEYTIPITFAQRLVQLESLDIFKCSKLKYVFGQCTRGDQGQSELKIELPALEKLRLTSNSNMVTIFPQYCSATLPSLHEFYMWDCPEFDVAINTFAASSWKLQDKRTIEKHLPTSETLVINNSNVESIFNLDGLEIIGQPVSLSVQYLRLLYLHQMKYICVGLKNSFTFHNLKRLQIYGCEKVEVIFPASVLRCLPELERLEITECQELKQIIEEDVENQKLSNFVSPQPCFPKLAALVINNCHNLKRLFCVSTSKDLLNLELLIIWGASVLEELIVCEQRQVDEIGKVKVELPKLKLLVLTYLSSLCQGIELPNPTLRVIHDCPKLPLTSSFATLEQFEGKLSELDKDLEVDEFYRWKLLNMVGEITKSDQDFVPEDTKVENSVEKAITYFPVGPKNEQAPHGETGNTIEIPQNIKRGIEEGATSHKAKLVTLSARSESVSPQPGPLVNSQHKSYPHTEIRLCPAKTYTDKESEGHPINIKDPEDDDLMNLVQLVEGDDDGQILTPVFVVAEDHPTTKDKLVVKVFADLEESLKMPLKDIASSEANSLHLLTALKFFSHLPLEDVALSGGLKDIIDSLHQEFPSILCSFKQAFAVTHKFAVLEEKERSIKEELRHQNEKAIKAKEKEEILKERIIWLEKEIKDHMAELSSLQEEKKKCIVEAIRLKKEFENVRRDKSQMMEDQRKARQQLFEVNYKWSALCSQFELNYIAARNAS